MESVQQRVLRERSGTPRERLLRSIAHITEATYRETQREYLEFVGYVPKEGGSVLSESSDSKGSSICIIPCGVGKTALIATMAAVHYQRTESPCVILINSHEQFGHLVSELLRICSAGNVGLCFPADPLLPEIQNPNGLLLASSMRLCTLRTANDRIFVEEEQRMEEPGCPVLAWCLQSHHLQILHERLSDVDIRDLVGRIFCETTLLIVDEADNAFTSGKDRFWSWFGDARRPDVRIHGLSATWSRVDNSDQSILQRAKDNFGLVQRVWGIEECARRGEVIMPFQLTVLVPENQAAGAGPTGRQVTAEVGNHMAYAAPRPLPTTYDAFLAALEPPLAFSVAFIYRSAFIEKNNLYVYSWTVDVLESVFHATLDFCRVHGSEQTEWCKNKFILCYRPQIAYDAGGEYGEYYPPREKTNFNLDEVRSRLCYSGNDSNVVGSSHLISRGVDLPYLNQMLVLLQTGKSHTYYMQAAGRIMRVREGKKACSLVRLHYRLDRLDDKSGYWQDPMQAKGSNSDNPTISCWPPDEQAQAAVSLCKRGGW